MDIKEFESGIAEAIKKTVGSVPKRKIVVIGTRHADLAPAIRKIPGIDCIVSPFVNDGEALICKHPQIPSYKMPAIDLVLPPHAYSDEWISLSRYGNIVDIRELKRRRGTHYRVRQMADALVRLLPEEEQPKVIDATTTSITFLIGIDTQRRRQEYITIRLRNGRVGPSIKCMRKTISDLAARNAYDRTLMNDPAFYQAEWPKMKNLRTGREQ